MKTGSPPKLLLRLFKWFCHADLHVYIEGDLLELYQERLGQSGVSTANTRFFIDILMLFRPDIIKPFSGFKNSNNNVMIKNYFKVSARNLSRHKGYTAINIIGLAVGLAISFVTILFVFDELSYDNFHKDGSRIYRITKRYFDGGKIVETVPFRSYLLDIMGEDISAIESITNLKPFNSKQVVTYAEKTFTENELAFADSNFFDFFSFDLLVGNPRSVLKEPYVVVISESRAIELFGDKSPLGEVIKIESAYDRVGFDAKVTGIFKDMPQNSHFHYDLLVSMKTGEVENDKRGIYGFPLKYGYLKLFPTHSIDEVSLLIPDIEEQHAPEFYADYDMHLSPQPMLDIHLRSNMEKELETNGDIRHIYVFSAVALVTLLIACFNYINLATARAVEKAKEVGVRKAIGAHRSQLIAQFLTESVLTSFFALVVACVLTILALPSFNAFSGKSLVLGLAQYPIIGFFILTALLVGIFSGIYPAFILSKRAPKHQSTSSNSSQTLRKGLIVLQFTISSLLIVATLVIFDQWEMLRNQRYSFKTEEIINIPVNSLEIRKNYPVIKNDLLKNADIKLVTGCDKDFISKITSFNGFTVPGHDGYIDMYYASIDANFFEMYGKKIIRGRNFVDYSTDSLGGVIINESAARLIGQKPEEILGLEVEVYPGYSPKIIGVVEDFQFQSYHSSVVPMYFQLFYTKEVEDHLKMITIQISTNHVPQTLEIIESTFKRFDEKALFDYSFLDNDIRLAYQSEERFSNILTLITIIAILIACLGTFGITTAVTNQRKKELGMRKVLGASISSIALLINKDFVRLVIIANCFAFPLAYVIMNYWLQNFASQIKLDTSTFLLATMTSLLVVIFGSGFWSIKVATSNPVESLKTD